MSRKIHDIFGPGSNFKGRVLRNYDKLLKIIEHCKGLGLKIVLTSGTFDLSHVGHYRYLEKAKQKGDILIVGVDSDKKVRAKKGSHRPIVNQDERLEILCHSRHVDLTFLKQAKDPKWHLIKTVKPDILIATKREYEGRDLEDGVGKYCGKIIIFESQATTSTTAKIRSILIDPAEQIKQRLKTAVDDVFKFLDGLTGSSGDK